MAKAKTSTRTPAQQAKKDRNREANEKRAADNKAYIQNLQLTQEHGVTGLKRPSKLVRQRVRTQQEGYNERVKAALTEKAKIAQKVKDDAARQKRKDEAKAKREAAAAVDLAIILDNANTTGVKA